MVKLNEEAILKASSGAAIATGASLLLPGLNTQFEKQLMSEKVTEPMFHHAGLMGASIGAMGLVSAKADSKTIKNMNKAMGVGWLACSGTHLYHAFGSKKQKREASIAVAAVGAVLGGLGLAAGFQKD